MASKAKTLQVKDKEKDDKAADAPEKDSPDAPSPLLDLSDAAVKKMIKQAKKRGFVTFDQLNEVLPSDTTSPEQIEDIMSMLSDMCINVSEAEYSDSEEENKEEPDAGPAAKKTRTPLPATPVAPDGRRAAAAESNGEATAAAAAPSNIAPRAAPPSPTPSRPAPAAPPEGEKDPAKAAADSDMD